MIKLVMDTSNVYLAVGLYQDDICLGKVQEYGSRRQSEQAIPELAHLLEENQLTLMDVDEMIITAGPGSYTGERVAMTIAKTLAAVSDVSIKVVSSLASYAGMDQALVILDARSKKLFMGIYDQGKAVVEDQLIFVGELASWREQYPEYQLRGQTDVVGEDKVEVDLCGNMLALGKLADTCTDVDLLVPAYIKKVEARKIWQ